MQENKKSILLWAALAISIVGVLPLFSGIVSQWGLWEPITGFRITRQYMPYSIGAAVLLLFLMIYIIFKDFKISFQLAFLMTFVFGAGYFLGINKEPTDWTGLRGIHDVSTDTINPPEFIALLDAPGRRNDFIYDGTNRMRQLAKFPWVKPLYSDLAPNAAFDKALLVAQQMNWEIAAVDSEAGRIEATDYTKWFHFNDDVVIRITANGEGSRIDMRSLSRVGGSDHGLGMIRIMKFQKAFNAE